MIQLTPMAKLVAITLILFAISLYSLYLASEINDRIRKKDNISKFESYCFIFSDSVYTLYITFIITQSAVIGFSLIYSIIRLVVNYIIL